MADDLKVKIEVPKGTFEAAEVLLEDAPHLVTIAGARAANRAVVAMRTHASKAARTAFAVKATDVRRALSITKASNDGKRPATMKAEGMRLPLSDFQFSPRQTGTRRTVRVAIRRGERNVYPEAFVGTAKGRMFVFRRLTDARYPIIVLKGLSVPGMLRDAEVTEDIEARGMEVLESRFEHEIQRALDKKAKK